MQNQEKKTLSRLAESIRRDASSVTCHGLAGAVDALMVSRLAQMTKRTMVVVVATVKEAERFFEDAGFFAGHNELLHPQIFPDYALSPLKSLAYHNQTAAERVNILYRLSQGAGPAILIITLTGLLRKIMPRKVLSDFAEIIMINEEIDPDALVRKLTAGGYTRSAIVEEAGDFSVRGGILDIFSPLYQNPVRVELFGDMVESLRFFSAATQRRLDDIEEAIILPAREAVLMPENTGRIIAALKKQAADQETPLSEIRELVSQLKAESGVVGMERLMPFLYGQLDSFFDYIPKDACFVFLAADNWTENADACRQRVQENFDEARSQGQITGRPEERYLSWATAQAAIARRRSITIKMIPGLGQTAVGEKALADIGLGTKDNVEVSVTIKNDQHRERPLSPLADWVGARQAERQTVIITAASRSQLERIESLLPPYGLSPVRAESFDDAFLGDINLYLVAGQISAGFVFPDEGLSIICEKEILGKRRQPRPRSTGPREQFLRLEDLKQGDLVVHVDHGIGCYEGVIKLTVEGITNDFLLIRYKDDDKLYLSVDRMDMAQKYIGVDHVEPVLDKMGGKSWHRVKGRAKHEVEKIAKELLALYAKRKVREGHPFTVADNLLQDFEAGFPHEETGDQLKVIEEVLADMQSPIPMDRLVCGDVGYGKTEVVMRAACVAVCDGKQVAVMVPTTVLAEQHLSTFKERFADLPVNIACLNRFRSARRQKDIVADLKQGRIDIVIGTHRLLSADVVFHDLGLVILDEEQRFGVKQKERLKKVRSTVDVLSLTATPIPRTLHLSLTGMRDISIINTAPERRRSVKTYISEFDDGIIKSAIRKELARGGQIYFVHNNIHKIDYIANRLQQLVPEIRLGVAHGRLAKDRLEREMMRFVNREIDMLVCTRIVESGLDIPSANTIFVNRADMFGLSQIYQLRGRVGRAEEQAYAYLFIPRDTALSKDAQKRLKVLMEHNDLGSGFQIAMSDLQIRGGGSALGVSQSGHIAAVGYDMFLQLMENSIAELKGETVREPLEPEVTIPMSSFLSESYISDMDQRMTFYRRLSRTASLNEISEIKEEMIDRYGAMPDESENLLLKVMLKVMAARSAIRKFDITDTHILITFSPVHLDKPDAIVAIVQENSDLFEITPQQVLKVPLSGRTGRAAVVFAKNTLKAIYRHVKN